VKALLVPAGLRGRLVAAILIVAVAVLAGSFFALHEGTGADLSREIDDQLRTDLGEFEGSAAGRSQTEERLEHRARAFIASQGYHGDSRIFAIQVGADRSGPVITNQREAITPEGDEVPDDHEDGDSSSPGILGAPQGLATIDAPDGGRLRVLTQTVGSTAEAPIGTFRVAQSLAPVGAAQGSLRDTLLVVGLVALLVLIAAAVWIATLVANPLKRIAGFAAEVDTADLDRRLGEDEGPAEVRSLSHSINHMLDRLQGSFEREREFVADASHELRTPVTIAQGELALLRRDSAPAERERLDVVMRELKRMERLVTEMLTLASEDSGGSERHERVDVSDLLSDLRRDLPLMGRRDYNVAEVGGTIEADPDRLAQVFRNLLVNAVAHTEVGGSVRVAAVPLGDRIRFEVRDDGPGFDAAEAEHLFDRFYRTDDGRSRDRGGSGLGLAIARVIVESHGGRIWAQSKGGPGPGGALVAFELPGYRP
jgi:two-component system OmpR family sensor kinase